MAADCRLGCAHFISHILILQRDAWAGWAIAEERVALIGGDIQRQIPVRYKQAFIHETNRLNWPIKLPTFAAFAFINSRLSLLPKSPAENVSPEPDSLINSCVWHPAHAWKVL
jgi:hypothetical protein